MRTLGAFLVTLLLLTSSLAWARKTPSSKPYAQLENVPEEAQALVNPLEGDPEAARAGQKIYKHHCASCHGAMGENGRKGPGLRAPEVQHASAGALFWGITHGSVRAGMPVWTKLPEAQRWQLVSYLKSLGVAASPESPPK